MTSVVLQCPATGSPEPTVTWSKSGQLIISGESRVTVTKDGELIIEKVRTTDSGDYTCSASSILGRDSAVSAIIIMSKYECTEYLSKVIVLDALTLNTF